MLKNTKNILFTTCCFVLVVVLLGLTLSLFRFFSNSNHSSAQPTQPVAYKITYKMVAGNKVQDVYEPLFKADGTYPIYYTEGCTVTVSDLNGRTSVSTVYGGSCITGVFPDPNNPNRDFDFRGWFLDENCTVPLVDNTFSGLAEDVTLYGKVIIGYWTDFY